MVSNTSVVIAKGDGPYLNWHMIADGKPVCGTLVKLRTFATGLITCCRCWKALRYELALAK